MAGYQVGIRFALGALMVGLLGGPGLAAAQKIGGTSTKTLEYHASDITSLSRTDVFETYTTRMFGFLAGNSSPLLDIQFALPYGDAAVQAAIATTRQLLSDAAAQPLAFSGPLLTSSGRVLTEVSSASSDVLTARDVLWVSTVELVGEELFHLNSDRFGCVAEVDGIRFDCTEDFGEIFVAAGDTVLLTSAGIVDRIARTTVFTETYLNSATYEITGSVVPASLPEPATAVLVALAGLAAGLTSLTRTRTSRSTRSA